MSCDHIVWSSVCSLCAFLQTSQEVFEEVLLGALQSDFTSALSTPEHLELLLVAMQKFPEVLKPKKLKKLLGSTTVITKENIPK